MTHNYPKMTYSDPKMTYSYPKVTYSDPKVTHSDPTHLPLPPLASPGHHQAISHTGDFPRGVGHRVENGWGLTKVAVVLLNGLLW